EDEASIAARIADAEHQKVVDRFIHTISYPYLKRIGEWSIDGRKEGAKPDATEVIDAVAELLPKILPPDAKNRWVDIQQIAAERERDLTAARAKIASDLARDIMTKAISGTLPRDDPRHLNQPLIGATALRLLIRYVRILTGESKLPSLERNETEEGTSQA